MRAPKVSGYEGKYDRFQVDPDTGRGIVSWSPGTGLKYVLFASPVSLDEAQIIGCGVDSAMASFWLRQGWVTFPLVDGQVHHETYMAEKLKAHGVTSESEVWAVTALANLCLGDEEYGVQVYERLIKKYR